MVFPVAGNWTQVAINVIFLPLQQASVHLCSADPSVQAIP
jgi:hypothetical protein